MSELDIKIKHTYYKKLDKIAKKNKTTVDQEFNKILEKEFLE